MAASSLISQHITLDYGKIVEIKRLELIISAELRKNLSRVHRTLFLPVLKKIIQRFLDQQEFIMSRQSSFG